MSSFGTVKANLRVVRREGGAATIAIAFLILVIISAALVTSLGVSGSLVRDASTSEEQVAALFIAESGLERAQQTLKTSGTAFTDATCTGLAGGPYTVDRGSFTLSAASTPASCTGSGCTSCAVTSVGIIGNVSRTITLGETLGAVNGTGCDTTKRDCTNATLTLTNPSSTTAAVAVFNLASRRLGANTGVTCAVSGGGACVVQWNESSSNGSVSLGISGVAVTIAASTSYTVTHTLDSSRNWAEVGAFFQGTSAPTVVGTYSSYWNDKNPDNTTINKNGSSFSGSTNNGASSGASSGCGTPALTTDSSEQADTCTNWCQATGANMLVMGFAGKTSSTSFTEGLTSPVTFGTGYQVVAMSKIASYPNSTSTLAAGDLYSEIWYAKNDYYLSPSADATSGGVVTGAIGVDSFNATLTNGSATMIVNSLPANTALNANDSINCTSGGACPAGLPKIIASGPGGCMTNCTATGAGNPYTLTSKIGRAHV